MSKKLLAIVLMMLCIGVALSSCNNERQLQPSSSVQSVASNVLIEQNSADESGAESMSSESVAVAPSGPSAALEELIIDVANISVIATENTDGTIHYIYRDTSIQPIYSNPESCSYGITFYATTAASTAITISSFGVDSKSNNDSQILDIAALYGWDYSLSDNLDMTVSVDENGLLLTWNSGILEEKTTDDIEAAYIDIAITVNDEKIAYEQLVIDLSVS